MVMYRLPEELDKVTPQQGQSTKMAVTNELDALSVVISAAEQGRRGEFINNAYQRRLGYDELYRQAFGKTVVIQTEKEGRLTFRVSQATCDYANTDLGFATPGSAIGRLCRVAKLGMTNQSDKWGEYTVVEIRSFSRFTGVDAANHIRNFRVMESNVLARKQAKGPLQVMVSNLRSSLRRWFGAAKPVPVAVKPVIVSPPSQPEVVTLPVTPDLAASPVASSSEPPLVKIVVPELDFDIDDSDMLDDDEVAPVVHFDIFGRSEEEKDDYYGLSNYFFLHPTDEQMAVMGSHVAAGPMLVEGVAGSGKTCAALGRAKTLCDLGREPDQERYNGDFLADSSVGFVRTGELVQYLRASCLELGVEHLPIEEYAELSYRLANVRDIEQRRTVHAAPITSSGSPLDSGALAAQIAPELTTGDMTKSKYQTLAVIPDYDFSHETSVQWLRTVCQWVGERLARELQQQIDTLSIPNGLATQDFLGNNHNAAQLLDLAKTTLNSAYSPIIRQLTGWSADAFVLDNLVSRLLSAHQQLENELFDKQIRWVKPVGGSWQKVRDAESAIALQRQAGTAFVIYDKVQVIDDEGRSSIERELRTVLVETSEDLYNLFRQGAVITDALTLVDYHIDDIDAMWQRRMAGELTCRCQLAGLPPVGITWARDVNDLNIHLLNNKLLGQIKTRVFLIRESNPYRRPLGEAPQSTYLAAQFRSQIRRVFNRLRYADLYSEAVHNVLVGDKAQANKVLASYPQVEQLMARLKQRQLAQHDKDLLLSLAHIMSRGVDAEARVPAHLMEQPYYRSVFIDEVQDFTEQQIFLMAEQADPKYHAVTLVGDMHQQLGQGNVKNIEACFPYRPLTRFLLKENKRQERQPQLAASAMLFRALVQQDERLHEWGQVDLWHEQAKRGSDKQFFDQPFDTLDKPLLRQISVQPHGRTIAVVCPTQEMATSLEARLRDALIAETSRVSHVADRIDLAKKYLVHFSCAEHVKGLEFDTVIYAGMEHIDWNDPHQLNKAYVTLSRPRKQLVMFGDESRLPAAVRTCLLSNPAGEVH